MCFSAEADFVAAAAVAPVGILALRSVREPRQWLVASLPLGFALHQFVEGFVWLGDSGDVSAGVMQAAIRIYLVFAQVVLPVLVPLAMLLLEPQRLRRLLMGVCLGIGIVTAARFGWLIFAHPVDAYPQDHAMVYATDLKIGPWTTAGYLLATCPAVVLSSHRWLRWFGVVNIIGFALAATIRYQAVTSVWCVYAALVSVMIVLYLRAPAAAAGTQTQQ